MSMAGRCRLHPTGLSRVTTNVSAPRADVLPDTSVNPMMVVPGGTLGSDVTVTRNCVVAPEATPPAEAGCATTLKNWNESGTNVMVAGAQVALFALRTVTKYTLPTPGATAPGCSSRISVTTGAAGTQAASALCTDSTGSLPNPSRSPPHAAASKHDIVNTDTTISILVVFFMGPPYVEGRHHGAALSEGQAHLNS